MKRILLLVAALLAASAASAVSAAAPAFTVTWAAPTQYTDGTTIVGAITYQMYVGAKGAEVKYKTPVTASPYVLVPTPGPGETCVYVTATVASVESAPSAEVCGTVAATAPKPPSVVAATVK